MKEQALSAKFHLPFSLTTMKATGRVPRTNENTEQGRQGCSVNTDIKVSIFENEIAVKKNHELRVTLNAAEWFNKNWSMDSEQTIH